MFYSPNIVPDSNHLHGIGIGIIQVQVKAPSRKTISAAPKLKKNSPQGQTASTSDGALQ
jgi:hypothetical protein